MTYLELIRDAEHKLEHSEITLGEYNELIEPLKRELEQDPKTGQWIGKNKNGDWHCSKCGAILEKDEQVRHIWSYCYHCGTLML